MKAIIMCLTKVSASIVSYNGYDEVAKAATSVLLYSKNVDLSLFLIDNASPDGTGEKLQKTDFDGTVKVITLDNNLGFGSGHNKVLPFLNSKYHAVINPDIVLEQDTLAIMCKWMDEHPDVAIATPRLMFPSGQEQFVAKRKPSFMALLSRQLPLKIFKKIEEHYLMLDEDLSKEREVDFCSGCFFVIRTDIFVKMGGFDEKYFMYVEDADITQMAKKHGKAYYLPQTFVYHAWHRDTRKRLKNFVMQIKSMMRYWRKWGFKFI